MKIPTLSELTRIARTAMEDALRESKEIVCGVPRGLKHDVAYYAVTAVLDAVGYRFPVDPEREAFDAWVAELPGAVLEPFREQMFDAWKAGRAARLPKPAPETFEAHGYTWFKHTPGDPCPCDGDAVVEVMLDVEKEDWASLPYRAGNWGWKGGIIGWRYADAP